MVLSPISKFLLKLIEATGDGSVVWDSKNTQLLTFECKLKNDVMVKITNEGGNLMVNIVKPNTDTLVNGNKVINIINPLLNTGIYNIVKELYGACHEAELNKVLYQFERDYDVTKDIEESKAKSLTSYIIDSLPR